MNKYQKILNTASKEALANHRMAIKLKYRDKWLIGGTPMDHPIYIAYELEFLNPSYRQIRRTLKKKYKNSKDIKAYTKKMIEDNSLKYFILFNEDIKYNNR